MRRLLPFAAVLAGLVGLAWLPIRADVLPPPTRAQGPTMLGVATCASAACHNANGDLGSKGSEYTTFVAVDPHARSYRALFNKDSVRIQKALLGKEPGKDRLAQYGKHAHENKLCLMCHGLGADVPQALQADGVGCEQCHGPAQNWKASHYLNGFDRTTAGFRDLRNLHERAAVCTACHVGDGTRQVDHDLIAAGHPRLKFEYGAYYANYPRHWKYREAAERRADPAREARNWLVGQAVSAEAALELLAVRARGTAWPEFAEYECTACHHGLTEPSERVKRLAERDAARARAGKPRLKPGRLPWGSWYHGLLPLFADRAPKELPPLLAELDAEMSKRGPDGQRVAKDARAAAALLRAWAQTEATKPGMGAAEVRSLARCLGKAETQVSESWDGGTQAYLGLAAMKHALSDLGQPTQLDIGGMRKALREAFPSAKGKTRRPLYDSPSAYDPAGLLDGLRAAKTLR